MHKFFKKVCASFLLRNKIKKYKIGIARADTTITRVACGLENPLASAVITHVCSPVFFLFLLGYREHSPSGYHGC